MLNLVSSLWNLQGFTRQGMLHAGPLLFFVMILTHVFLIRRTNSAPGGLDADEEDILLIYQDFDATMEEVTSHYKHVTDRMLTLLLLL